MSKMKFQLKPVETKPSRRFKKGSKYDPVIDEFLEGKESLVEVNVKGKTANYLIDRSNDASSHDILDSFRLQSIRGLFKRCLRY